MDINDILKNVPIDDIAEKFGVSKDAATEAVKEGGAVLLGGLSKQAETDEGSSAIEQALAKHEGFAGASKVDDIDQADGEKIVNHVLGNEKQNVASTLAKSEKSGGIDFAKLLPMLAPIVMGLIANNKKSSGGGLGDVIGGLLGGGNEGGGLGDVLGGLGGLFGGGNSTDNNNGGGGLGDLLGGLFGGKK